VAHTAAAAGAQPPLEFRLGARQMARAAVAAAAGGSGGAAALGVVVAAGRLGVVVRVGDCGVLVARGGAVLELWGVCCFSLIVATLWGRCALAQRTVLGPGPCRAGVGVHVFQDLASSRGATGPLCKADAFLN
jgi:hypothetical protein